jgi:hypothetical protein
VLTPTPNELTVSRATRRRGRRYALALALVIIGWAVVTGPSSADIRLDTGDLRYRFLGIPLYYEPMREPCRTQLLQLARESKTLTDDWCQCADFPLPTSNNTHLMCRTFYCEITAWIKEDPTLALLIAEDVARYIRQTQVREGLPESIHLLSYARPDPTGNWILRPGWRDDEAIKAYLAARGYTR